MGRLSLRRMERAAQLCTGRAPPLRHVGLRESRRPEFPERLLIEVVPMLAIFKVADTRAARAPRGSSAACPPVLTSYAGFADGDDSRLCLPPPLPLPRKLRSLMDLNERMVLLRRELHALETSLTIFKRLAEHRVLTLTNLSLDALSLALEALKEARLWPDDRWADGEGELRRKLGSLRASLPGKLTQMINVHRELGGLCLSDALAEEENLMEMIGAQREGAVCTRPHALTWQVHNGTDRVAQAAACLLSAMESGGDVEFLRRALNPSC